VRSEGQALTVSGKTDMKLNPLAHEFVYEEPAPVAANKLEAGPQKTFQQEDKTEKKEMDLPSKIFISATRADGSSYYANTGVNLENWPNKTRKFDFKFLYDTGACASLLGKHAYDKLPEEAKPKLIPIEDLEIIGANNGTVNCYGYCYISINLNGQVYPMRTFVCDISNDGIIGTEFMFDEHDCTFTTKKMKNSRRTRASWFIDGHQVPLHPYKPSNATFHLVAKSDQSLAAGEEYLIRSTVVGYYDETDTFLVTMPHRSEDQLDNLQVANSLATPKKGEVIVRLINVGEKPVVVKKGDTLAQMERVSDHYISPQIQDNEKTASSDENDVSKKKRQKKIRLVRNIRIRNLAVNHQVPEHLQDLFERSKIGLNETQVNRLKNILVDHSDCFAKHKKDFGHTTLVEHDIETGDAPPCRQKLRIPSLGLQDEEERLINEMLDEGQIEPSSSPWASPVCMVKKKDGSTRFCIDYRKLNDLTIKDAYPLPRVQDCLNTLNGGEYFCTLDLKSGYWQVGMTERAKERSAFVCRQGLFQWKCMPFGLCNAPPTFERLMETVLKGMQWKTCLVYLDDIVIFGKTFEQCAERLTEVLGCLKKAGLKLKPKKCTLFQRKVHFLGHVVSKEGIHTDPEKVEQIRNWPMPKEGLLLGRKRIPFVTQIKSFLGICSYYRKFLPEFAKYAEPLQAYTRDGADLTWTKEAEDSFNKLKELLTEAPVLAYPQLGQPFIIDTDACDWAMGAVLSQKDEKGNEHPIVYMSKVFNKTERNYCIWRKEFLAAFKAVKDFEPYITGQECLLRTDNTCVTKMMRMPELSNQNGHMVQYLDSMGVKVVHRKGTMHVVPDALSRKPENDQFSAEQLEKHRCQQCTPKVTKYPEEVVSQSTQTNWSEIHRVTTRSEKAKWKQLLDGYNLDEWTTESLVQAQEDDKEILYIKEKLKSGVKPDWHEISSKSFGTKSLWNTWDSLEICDNILYRNIKPYQNLPGKLQLVLPRSLRLDTFKTVHGTPFGGHLGYRKTLAKIRARFFWPRMATDIKIWILQCDSCQQNKPITKRTKAHMQIHIVGEPMERSAADIAGPLPVTKDGNKYIVIIGDYFTKWLEAIPIQDQKAETVAKAVFTHYILKFGVPLSMHTDQGKNFESALWKELCTILGIKKTRTTAYRPQSDGYIERFNRTMWSMLRATIQEKKQDWDLLVPILAMAYRASVNDTTGFTPNMLMLGREVTMPIDLMIPKLGESDEEITYADYVNRLRNHMDNIYDQVRSNTEWAVNSQKRHYDTKSGFKDIKIGDLVWYNIPSIADSHKVSRKLKKQRKGPYLVVKKRGDVKFVVAFGKGQVKPVHIDQLFKYNGVKRPRWMKSYLEEIALENQPKTKDIGCGTNC